MKILKIYTHFDVLIVFWALAYYADTRQTIIICRAKIPIGYFLISNLNSSQKAELTRHALNLLKETGVNIVRLTFDRCSTNVTMAKFLGCNFNIKTLNTKFIVHTTNNVDVEVAVFLDPAHMVKLVRNAFGEKKLFKDCDGKHLILIYVKH